MTHPSQLKIEDFEYDLPEDRIAKFPLESRSNSKLLEYKNGEITARVFGDIVDALPESTLLVYNNTKVFYARLGFIKSTGARIEVFCLEPHQQEINLAMQQRGKAVWKCMIGNAKRWKSEPLFMDLPGHEKLSANLLGKEGNDYLVELNWDLALSFSELMDLVGQVPLPPYLKREAEESDKSRYQTVYSKREGSVAAPTAGLHFTDAILDKLKSKSVDFLPLTLHVGAGTFQPVKAEVMSDHDMHSESFSVSRKQLELLQHQLQNNLPIAVVGTTSLRALESLFWVDENQLKTEGSAQVQQWTPYEGQPSIKPIEKIKRLLHTMDDLQVDELSGKTRIIIAPGYAFQFADILITNFHQPQSTLLLLVSAFVGGDWKSIYNYALNNDFRFLSYGDSSMLWLSNS